VFLFLRFFLFFSLFFFCYFFFPTSHGEYHTGSEMHGGGNESRQAGIDAANTQARAIDNASLHAVHNAQSSPCLTATTLPPLKTDVFKDTGAATRVDAYITMHVTHSNDLPAAPPVKRGRGRPRKHPLPAPKAPPPAVPATEKAAPPMPAPAAPVVSTVPAVPRATYVECGVGTDDTQPPAVEAMMERVVDALAAAEAAKAAESVTRDLCIGRALCVPLIASNFFETLGLADDYYYDEVHRFNTSMEIMRVRLLERLRPLLRLQDPECPHEDLTNSADGALLTQIFWLLTFVLHILLDRARFSRYIEYISDETSHAHGGLFNTDIHGMFNLLWPLAIDTLPGAAKPR
jgi:hypothetical protein